jgi:hypothetical protein
MTIPRQHYNALTRERLGLILPKVPPEKAKTFAERLPPILPREEEEDISQLSDDMVEVLYPGRRPRRFRIDIAFDRFDGEDYQKAVAIARESKTYRETGEGAAVRHSAGFESTSALRLRDLFELVGHHPETEVLVNGKDVPYAREIWLPLFWIFPQRGA